MRYAVHNTVRGRTNRTLRAAAPAHLRLAQFVLGRRILRGRPIVLSEEELRRTLADLREKARRGAIEVRTMDGRRVDLTTLEPAPAHAPAPAPRPLPDSLARDDAWGEKMTPAGDLPTLLAEAEEDAASEQAPAAATRPDIPPALPGAPAAAPEDEPKLPALLADTAREETDAGATSSPKRGKKR